MVFLHGGPGGGSSPDHRRQFDPASTISCCSTSAAAAGRRRYAEPRGNTTWHLVDDIERLRDAGAGVEKWQVFGGSWGSTLALAYAETHPERVTELVLRGIFLFDQDEIDWLYRTAARRSSIPKVGGIPGADPRGRARRSGRGLSQAADGRRQGCAARRRQGVEQVGRRHRHPATRARDGRASSPGPSRGRRRPDREPLYGHTRAGSRKASCFAAQRSCAAFPASSSRGGTIAALRRSRPGSSSRPGPRSS